MSMQAQRTEALNKYRQRLVNIGYPTSDITVMLIAYSAGWDACLNQGTANLMTALQEYGDGMPELRPWCECPADAEHSPTRGSCPGFQCHFHAGHPDTNRDGRGGPDRMNHWWTSRVRSDTRRSRT